MSLQARRIGETQAQYRRRVGTKRPQTVNPGLSRQKVERVSVTPQDMKATDRGRPVTKIGNKTIYEADMREAKANYQNLLEAQRRQLQVAEAKAVKGLPSKRITVEQQLKNLQRQAKILQNRKNVPPNIVKIVNAQIEKLKKIQEGAKPRPLQQATNIIRGDPNSPEFKRQQKEFERKSRIAERYMKGEIGRRDLKGTFTPQEIRGLEKGSVYRKFMDGKITDRQLSRSGMFSLREIRDIKRSAQFNRMSPEERRAFIEREQRRQLRRQRPDRRRRQVRRAYRRVRGGDRDNVITFQTTGRRRRVSPTQTQRRRRVAPTQRRRRGMRVPI